MPTHRQTPNPPRWQPTWRRVGATSVGAFVVVLGFLGGRMNAGADPGLANSSTKTRSAVHQKAAATSTTTRTQTQTQTQTSPATASGYASVTPDPNPPTTHSS